MNSDSWILLGAVSFSVVVFLLTLRLLALGFSHLREERQQLHTLLHQTRRFYEAALSDSHQKFLARDLPQYSISHVGPSGNSNPSRSTPVMLADTGEVFEDEVQQSAIAHAAKYGVSYTEAIKAVSQANASMGGPLGNEAIE